jgi:hypothetical protein
MERAFKAAAGQSRLERWVFAKRNQQFQQRVAEDIHCYPRNANTFQ